MQHKATQITLCSGYRSGSEPQHTMFNSSQFANGRYNFIYRPPRTQGEHSPSPLTSGNPPVFVPLFWGHLGSVSVCRWVTTAPVSMSRRNRPGVSRCPASISSITRRSRRHRLPCSLPEQVPHHSHLILIPTRQRSPVFKALHNVYLFILSFP